MRKQYLKEYVKLKSSERGKNIIIEMFWLLFFRPLVSSYIPGSKWRKFILILFGAQIGTSVKLFPGIKIKMPWKLLIGDYSWIGEEAWIDNISPVEISDNVCISQGVYLCTGNHNFKKSSFDPISKPIIIESHVWIGAKTVIGPGYRIGSGSIITIGSVVKENIPRNSIFKNNKCLKL